MSDLLSIHICAFTAITLLIRLRQTRLRDGWIGNIFLLAMASLCIAYVQKMFGRMDSSAPASAIDVWRETSLFLAVLCKVVSGWKNGRN